MSEKVKSESIIFISTTQLLNFRIHEFLSHFFRTFCFGRRGSHMLLKLKRLTRLMRKLCLKKQMIS